MMMQQQCCEVPLGANQIASDTSRGIPLPRWEHVAAGTRSWVCAAACRGRPLAVERFDTVRMHTTKRGLTWR